MEAETKLGALLRATREAKGATLAQAEKATRIRQKYLEALEENRTSDLPEPVFVKGFLRNYAIYLGLNVQEVLDLWRGEHGLRKETAGVEPEIEPLRTPSRLTPAMLTVVLALIVFSLVMYYLYQQYAAPPMSPTPMIILDIATATPTPPTAGQTTPAVTRVPTPAQQDVTVPDVAGLSLQEADDALKALGLRIEVVDRQFSATAAAGIVLSQTVRSQTKVQKDSVIGVSLSRGSQLVSVPRLVGSSYTEAAARLAALGLKVQRSDVTAQGAANSVIGQDPVENAQVQPNSVVKVTVSIGDVVTVPDVRGMSLEQGKDTLLKAGLVIGQVSFQGKDRVPLSDLVKVCVGCVLSTDPPAGRIVSRNTTINMGVRQE